MVGSMYANEVSISFLAGMIYTAIITKMILLSTVLFFQAFCGGNDFQIFPAVLYSKVASFLDKVTPLTGSCVR